MKKILLIIRREYVTRVRKRSFIVMTFLGPLLMAAMVIVPVYIATVSKEIKIISVIDKTGIYNFENSRESNNYLFHTLNINIDSAIKNFANSSDYALLYIPKSVDSHHANAILYSTGQTNMDVRSYLENIMSKQLEELNLDAQLQDLNKGNETPIHAEKLLRSIKSSANIIEESVDKEGMKKKNYPLVKAILGMFSGILIYFFIFMFGSQVLRGVIEEKTSRIVEVIISSVKPFQLMMGKIVGVAMVGLTQFLLWIIITASIVIGVTVFSGIKFPSRQPSEKVIVNAFPSQGNIQSMVKPDDPGTNNDMAKEVMDAIVDIDYPVVILSFIFYFLFGYLLYAGFFAAIGSAVDSEADTQQFMLPVTIPLVFAMIMAQYVMKEPQGPMALWLSMIPLTSPVIMMVRIPFGVSWVQVALSMSLLVATFLGVTWMAGRIYRTGILMYGSKVSYRELWKWLKYRQ